MDAAITSPLLRETWRAGSPLNWLEFITGACMARPTEDDEEEGLRSAAGG